MVDNAPQHEPSIYIGAGSSSRSENTIGDTLPQTDEHLVPVIWNFSYPLRFSKGYTLSTEEQTPRSRHLYWDALEEIDDPVDDLEDESRTPHRVDVHDSPNHEIYTNDRLAFHTPSRALVATWILPAAKGDRDQSGRGSHIHRRQGRLFLSLGPEQIHAVVPSPVDSGIDQQGWQPTLSYTGQSKQNRPTKSNNLQGLFSRPPVPTEQRHRAVKLVNAISHRPKVGYDSLDLTLAMPRADTAHPPAPLFDTDRSLFQPQRGTADVLSRVDETTAMGEGDTTVVREGAKRSEATKAGSPVIRNRSDSSSSYANNKRKESLGSFRRKSKDEAKAKDGKGGFLHRMTEWFSVSEPSTQALKQHKRDVFRKAGVTMDDPQAVTKLHVPLGEVPAEAIRPSGPGPDPEDIFKKEMREKKRLEKRSQGSSITESRASQTSSSRSDFSRPADAIFPFD